MARTALTVQKVDRITGVVPSYTAANGSGGNSFANDGRTFLHVKNGSGAPIVATLLTPGNVDGLDIVDPTVTIAAGSEKMIGPFETNIFNQPDYACYVDWSAVTTVTVGVLRL